MEDFQPVLKLLPEHIAEKWNNQNDFHQYILQLGSYDADKLNKEPQKLSEKITDVSNQIRDLAVTDYKKFIETADNSRKIYKRFRNTESKLDELVAGLPDFETRCNDFRTESKEIEAHRKFSSLMCAKNAKLIEILELPRLMEKSIEDGRYDDALDTADFIERTAAKHPDIRIFDILLNEVQELRSATMLRLLSRLRTDVELGDCLRAVGHLRRMKVFSEAELRLKFLQARDAWLRASLEEIENEPGGRNPSKTIEFSRVRIFHVITQYGAIFGDDRPPTSHSKNDDTDVTAIFQSWALEKISKFLLTLEQDIANTDASSFGSTAKQCSFFGLSFGRVGCDFRALVEPIVAEKAFAVFDAAVRTTTTKFESDIERFTLIDRIYPVRKSSDEHGNLDGVLNFYPLAEYCNGLLAALNDLRTCAPLSLVGDAIDTLRRSLSLAARTILVFYGQERQAFTDVAAEQFSYFVECFIRELVPHVERCVAAIFPPNIVAEHLNTTPLEIEKAKLSTLDIEYVSDCIKHLLPVRIESNIDVGLIPSENSR